MPSLANRILESVFRRNERGSSRRRYHRRREERRHEVVLPPCYEVAIMFQQRQAIAFCTQLRKLQIHIGKNVDGAAAAGGTKRDHFDEEAVLLKMRSQKR